MFAAFTLVRSIGLGLLAMMCAAIAVRMLASALKTGRRMTQATQGWPNVLKWADRNGYTILYREAVRGGPFLNRGMASSATLWS